MLLAVGGELLARKRGGRKAFKTAAAAAAALVVAVYVALTLARSAAWRNNFS